MNTRFTWLTVGVLLTVGIGTVAAADDKDAGKLKITFRKKDDTSEITRDKDKATLAIKSPSGIGQAVMERQEEAWPKEVVLRLHLKGLESFRAQNGKVRLDAAASIGKQGPMVRQWKDNKETPGLDEKSLYWMEIRILTSDGKPAKETPLKDGYFEIVLPKAFLEDNPKSIILNWIDFYRQ